MTMISKLLKGRDENHTRGVWLHALSVLLQGLSLHAVENTPGARQDFAREMATLEGRLTSAESEADLMVVIGGVLKEVERYNREAARLLHMHASELQAAITIFAQALAMVPGAGSQPIHQLQELGCQLRGANELERIRDLRVRSAECLKTIQTELKRQESESAGERGMAALGLERLQGTAEPSVVVSAHDRVTGLAGREAAEAALAESLAESTPTIAAAIVVTRVPQINARFGHAAGDSVLSYFANYVGSGLNTPDSLFRWNGPCFVALIRSNKPSLQIEQQLKRLLSAKLQHELDMGSRTALIPLSCRWTAWPVSEPVATLVNSIDRFVAQELPHVS